MCVRGVRIGRGGGGRLEGEVVVDRACLGVGLALGLDSGLGLGLGLRLGLGPGHTVREAAVFALQQERWWVRRRDVERDGAAARRDVSPRRHEVRGVDEDQPVWGDRGAKLRV